MRRRIPGTMRCLGLACLVALTFGASTGRAAPALESTIQAFTLENGLRVFVRPIPGATGGFARVLYTIGEEDDPPGQSGLAQLMARLIGTARAGDVVPPMGRAVPYESEGPFESTVEDDFTSFCEGAPADAFRAALQDAALRMGDLRIEAEDLRRRILELRAEVLMQADGPRLQNARRIARDRLLPLPGGGLRGGVDAEVAGLSLEVVRERWRRFYKPANALLVVAGNVDPELVRKGVERLFGRIPAGETLPAAAPPAPRSTDAELLVLGREPPEPFPFALGPSTRMTGPPAACLRVSVPQPADPRRVAATLLLEMRFALDPAADRTVAPKLPPTSPTGAAPATDASSEASRRDARAVEALRQYSTVLGRASRAVVHASPQAPHDQQERDTAALSANMGVRAMQQHFAELMRVDLEPRASFDLWRDARAIEVVWSATGTPSDASAIESLKRRLRGAASGPVTPQEVVRLQAHVRGLRALASDGPEEGAPSAVALGIARRVQLGLDAQALLEAVAHLTEADLRAAAEAPSAAVVIGDQVRGP